ncbi:autotransporter domain-containing protein [Akkermansia sp.]|uniref:autotransporter domain-containing protein n=1 Tax=Akkermansia sp. TaxID=1872421 RepID=UPI0025BC9EBC|nr:autotransporter domain-containing protein [Akkermansia sp.]MCC8147847.1 autotransporter domain-containing protein [Akkermansia sp.]
MYMGDSITHGVNSGSYRWALHKIFADNGIAYTEQGIKEGNYSGGIASGSVYGGRVFNNIHSAEASARTYEIAGRPNSGGNYGRFSSSNINNWLGLSDKKTNGTTYSETKFTGDNAPNTYFLLTGTNDLLSQGWYNNSNKLKELEEDMTNIVTAMHTANSNAEIFVLSIPCWTQHSNSNSADIHQAIVKYNETLKTWGENNKANGVTVIDINTGIIDVASSTPFYGVRSMFHAPGSDGLHPNAQGDLLMAGNLAKAMGYAGRSAGQARKAAHELGVNFGQTPVITQQALTDKGFTANNVTISNNTINFNKSGNSTLTYNWGSSQGQAGGYTVDFTLRLGNGGTGGWDTTNNFSLNLGNGTLNINEAYIQWGSTILYSKDMSANTDSIRVAYVAGDNANGLSAGYYIWLGDVLIGEAQTAAGASSSGLTFSYSGTLDAILSNLALDGSLSYAPSSSGITGPESIYLVNGSSSSALRPGMIEWTTAPGATAVAPAGADNTYNTRNSTNSNIATITGTGSTKLIYANNGAYGSAASRQDLWVTLGEGISSNNGWIGGHTSGDLYGDIHLRLAEGAIGKSTVFGVVNAGTVYGDIYLEFSSSTGTYDTSFTSGEADRTSVAGSYASAVDGDITMVFNDGVFSHRIFGGVYTGAKTISGSTSLYINGGTFMNEIYAGNKTEGTISQGTSLTVTGTDAILGKVDGENWAWTLLCSGNKTSGTINGGTTITLKDIAATTGAGSEHKFDKYAGTLDGKGAGAVNGDKKLVFDHYTTSFLGTLQNFDKVQVTGNSELTLDKALGDTVASLSVDAGSSLRFNQDQGATLDITNNGTIHLSHNLTLKSADSGTGTYQVEGGTLDLAGQAVSGKISISAGTLANTSGLGNKSVSVSGVTGNINMGGLDGSKLNSINMGSGTGTISGLTGNADLSASTTQLRLSASNMGADGTGLIQFNDAAASSLTLGELTLTLTADAVSQLNAPGDYAFHITNATLHADPNNIKLSEYNGMAWDISRTENGQVIISFGQLDAMVIDKENVKNVTSASTLGATPSVTNNGTLDIDLSGGVTPEDKQTTINYLAGTESDAAVNTGNDSGVIITLLNETSADPDKPGNTAYAGSIQGAAQLVKDGEQKLTIDGKVTASALDVQQGELVLQNRTESSIISGTLDVGQDAKLTLNSASLAATDLTGSGTIKLNGGALLTITRETLSDLTLSATVTGTGTLKLDNCNLILGTGSNLGENVLLHLGGGSLRLQDGSTIALEGLHQEQENGALHLGTDGRLELASSDGKTYSFKGDISGTGTITHRGEGTQIILSSGNGQVDVSHSQAGGHLVLGDKELSADGSMAYKDISIGSNARAASGPDATADLSLMNNTTANTLSVASNGKLYLGGNPNQRAVQLVLTGNNNGVAANLASGASLDLTVNTETIASSANSGWAAIQANDGSIQINGAQPSINLNIYGLGTAGDWAILPEFTINALYATGGLVTDGGTSWTEDMVNLTYAGFANLVYDIDKKISEDGKSFQVHFTRLGDSPLKEYAATDNQRGAVDSLWAVLSSPQNINSGMMEFLNAVGNAQAAGNAGAIQSALSSYAGSGITALHSAQKGALKDQVLHLRNRLTQSGASLQYVNDDLPRFNAWIEGEGGYRKLNDQGDKSGYKLNSWGGTFGFDVTCSDSFVWGAAFSASYGDLDAYMASGNLDSYYGNLFFRLQSGRWAHNVILTYGWNDASLDRTAGMAGAGMYSMHGSTSGSSYGAFYEGTYDLYLNENKSSVFQPLVNASIYKSRMDGFTESGDLGMSVEDMDSTYGTVGLGARLRGELSSNLTGRASMGELRLQVVQNLGDRKTAASLAPNGTAGAGFRVHGSEEGSTGVQIGAGLTIPTGYTSSVFADVNADFRSRSSSVNASLGYRLTF